MGSENHGGSITMFIAHSTRTMANAKFKLGKAKDEDVRVRVIHRVTAEQTRREADRARRIRKHQEHIAAIRAQELAPVMERIAILNRATGSDMRTAATIVASVSEAEGIDIVDVMGTDRTHVIADARHRCIA